MSLSAPPRYLSTTREKMLTTKYYQKVAPHHGDRDARSLGLGPGGLICKMLDMGFREFGLSEAR
jgi:hypothetical protein